jgi:hypothetical protein
MTHETLDLLMAYFYTYLLIHGDRRSPLVVARNILLSPLILRRTSFAEASSISILSTILQDFSGLFGVLAGGDELTSRPAEKLNDSQSHAHMLAQSCVRGLSVSSNIVRDLQEMYTCPIM